MIHFRTAFLAFVLLSFVCKAQNDTTSCFLIKDTLSVTNFIDADSLLRHAHTCVGKRYRYSGRSLKTGFDCSGFVHYNFKRFGIVLPHSSYEQVKLGEKVEPHEAKPGDLIFFKGRNTSSKMAGHVGIVVSVSEKAIKFIHAAVTGGVRYDNTTAEYYKKRLIGVRRLKS